MHKLVAPRLHDCWSDVGIRLGRNTEAMTDEKPSPDSPLTLPELREMATRYAEGTDVRRLVDQAIERRVLKV